MIRRFCTYAVLRNLRFFDAFFVLFLLLELEFSYTLVGIILAYEKLLMGALEIPLAVMADRFGRKRALIWSFSPGRHCLRIIWRLSLFATSLRMGSSRSKCLRGV